MRIAVHILVCFVVVGLSFVHATTYQGIARSLSLIGPVVLSAIQWCPLALLVAYGLVARVTRRDSSRLAWLAGASGVVVLAIVGPHYPDWVVERYSEKIEIGSFVGNDLFLPPDVVRRFEEAFGTPTAQLSTSGGGPWLIVPRAQYSPLMVAFLKEEARRRAEPKD
jgi:Na+/proline symporter